MSPCGLAMVVGGLPGRDFMASDGFVQMRHESTVLPGSLEWKLERWHGGEVSVRGCERSGTRARQEIHESASRGLIAVDKTHHSGIIVQRNGELYCYKRWIQYQ